MRYMILFSPALTLLVMTVVVLTNGGEITGTLLVGFLAVLTLSVAAAEVVRFKLRKEVRDYERPKR